MVVPHTPFSAWHLILWAPLVVLAQDARSDRAALTHEHGSVVLNIESGRPMARAAEALMQEYGYAIAYEDPRYENPDDLDDITTLVRRGHISSSEETENPVLVPKTRRAKITLPEPKSQTDIGVALAKVADTLGGGGGRFEIEQTARVVTIVPRDIRDKNGNWISHGSVLDNLISLPKRRRTKEQLIGAICDAVSAASGVRVSPGMGMVGGLVAVSGPPTYELGADNERARDVLVRALALIGGDKMRQTWFMFYGDARTDNSYAMNFFQVPTHAQPIGLQPKGLFRSTSTPPPSPNGAGYQP